MRWFFKLHRRKRGGHVYIRFRHDFNDLLCEQAYLCMTLIAFLFNEKAEYQNDFAHICHENGAVHYAGVILL